MASIGILTFHYSNNFGAVLQAYGLSKAIAALGHSVEILDYRPLAARREHRRWPRHPCKIIPSAVAHWRFRQFRQHHLPLSRRTYWTQADLRCHQPEVDCMVCGSDQIWNISSWRGFCPEFFFEFLKGPTPKRVSYAATFGYRQELGTHKQLVCDLLSQFAYLSVRDTQSLDMIRELIGRTAAHVLDPSFLVNYDSITPPQIIGSPYTLVYCLNKTDCSTRAVHTLRERLGYPVISINKSFDGTKVIRSAGPLQWLSLMHYATYVCTNSFHGTCFSLANRKDFIALPIGKGLCQRLEDILRIAGIPQRLAKNDDELERCLSCSVDYETVSPRIEEARKYSLSFLQRALA